jgi:hypothetical protein
MAAERAPAAGGPACPLLAVGSATGGPARLLLASGSAAGGRARDGVWCRRLEEDGD